jgi:hypothetical protein
VAVAIAVLAGVARAVAVDAAAIVAAEDVARGGSKTVDS